MTLEDIYVQYGFNEQCELCVPFWYNSAEEGVFIRVYFAGYLAVCIRLRFAGSCFGMKENVSVWNLFLLFCKMWRGEFLAVCVVMVTI